MSVEIKKTGPCKDCEYFDPWLRTTAVEGKYPVVFEYSLHCRLEPTCYKVQEAHKEAMREIDDALRALDEV